MADEMCNFYMMYWYDPQESALGAGIPESACSFVNENTLDFPYDSDVPLPGSGPKMEMKRHLVEGKTDVLLSSSYLYYGSITDLTSQTDLHRINSL